MTDGSAPEPTEPREVTHSDVVCTVCNCLCDDLVVQVTGDRVVPVSGACERAENWFDSVTAREPSPHRIGDREVPLTEAIARAVELLGGSVAPLIYGLTATDTAGQRAAVALADRIGGTIDHAGSGFGGDSAIATQTAGHSTCTLGEVRHRSDLVIFWRTDPLVTHPRHAERYSVFPPGDQLPNGRADRTVVVIGAERTETAEIADRFVRLPIGADRDFLTHLRMLLVDEQPVTTDDRFDTETVSELATMIRGCRYGAVFYGPEIAPGKGRHLVIESLNRMVIDANRFTRFTAHPLADTRNGAGAEQVLCWQTGYPFAVDFSRGYPRYGPGEFDADTRLTRGDVDACVVIGGSSVTALSPSAIRNLEQLPTVVLDPSSGEFVPNAEVTISTATFGLHTGGTAYRSDGVCLPVKRLLSSPLPSDAEVLTEMMRNFGDG